MSPMGNKAIGGLGALLVATGVVTTIWGMVEGKDVNSVGLASIFVSGVALVYAGIFGLLPEEIGFGDKGRIKMQAAADAVKTVKEAANSEASAIAQSPSVLRTIVLAKDDAQASAAVEHALKELVERMPSTAEVLKTVS